VLTLPGEKVGKYFSIFSLSCLLGSTDQLVNFAPINEVSSHFIFIFNETQLKMSCFVLYDKLDVVFPGYQALINIKFCDFRNLKTIPHSLLTH